MLKPGGDWFIQSVANTFVYEIYKEMSGMERWKKNMFDMDLHFSPEFISNDLAPVKKHLDEFFPGSYQAQLIEHFSTFKDVEAFKGEF